MALLIDKTIDYQGLTLDSIYVRLEYKVAMDSASVKINARPFANKNIYQNQGYYSHLNIQDFSPYMTFKLPYDRVEDGDFVLDVVHSKTKDYLSTDITEERYLFYEDYPRDPSGNVIYDPSTGEPDYSPGDPIIDPSTGLQETETIITRHKFAQDSSIQIVDVSIS